MKRAALVATLLGPILLRGARADEKEWVLSAQPGFASLGVAGRTAWGGGGGLDLSYGVADGLSLRATGSLSAHRVTADGAQAAGTALAWHAGVGLSYAIDIVRVVPQLDFAIGLIGTRLPSETGAMSDQQFGIELGIGVDYLVSRRVAIGVFARYHAPLASAAHLPLYLYAGPRIALHFGG